MPGSATPRCIARRGRCPPVRAPTRHRSQTLPCLAGEATGTGASLRRISVQPIHGRGGQEPGHRGLRHRLQLSDGKLSRRLPPPGIENRAIPPAPQAIAETGGRMRRPLGHRRRTTVCGKATERLPWQRPPRERTHGRHPASGRRAEPGHRGQGLGI